MQRYFARQALIDATTGGLSEAPVVALPGARRNTISLRDRASCSASGQPPAPRSSPASSR